MAVGKLMQELRDKLDDLDISWHDTSDSWDSAIAERTKIDPLYDGGKLTSVVYIYSTDGSIGGMSYGYPDRLECWNMDWTDDPIPMSVDDIIWNLVNYQPTTTEA